ncbi:MAG: dTDP-4-dehydrorhamnose reductase [Blastocatellia bacterium]|nr:dTDP-4-dehydrorhamnose reductase [Blastocatellia bacterium]
MRTIITGAGGMLAGAVIAACRRNGHETLALSRTDLDISDADAVDAAFDRIMPDAVLNCAAYTDVDGAEVDEERCFAANATGVKNLAESALRVGAKLITVSTDYVFGGEKSDHYVESDAPNPLGVYARSKVEGETLALNANPDCIVVRSGWIFGPGGTNFLSMIPLLLADGRQIKVISDAFGTPTYAKDLAQRMLELASSPGAGIVHAANAGGGTSFSEFAMRVCEIGRFDKSLVTPVTFASLARPAPRPRSSKLASMREDELGLHPMPKWESAVERFVEIVRAG